MRWWVGNDVVDLTEPGAAGKAGDRRFVDRVFTPAERAYILDAAAPALALWKTWAAKETAYKIASKLREGVVFAHRAFEVEPEASAREARVRFQDLEVRVRWETALEYVHCIGHCFAQARAAGPAEAGLTRPGARRGEGEGEAYLAWRRLSTSLLHERAALDGALSPAERASVHSRASARARLLARRLLDRWGLHGAEVLRQRAASGWGPPVVACQGDRLPGFDISLSHDGRFVAAVLLGPA